MAPFEICFSIGPIREGCVVGARQTRQTQVSSAQLCAPDHKPCLSVPEGSVSAPWPPVVARDKLENRQHAQGPACTPYGSVSSCRGRVGAQDAAAVQGAPPECALLGPARLAAEPGSVHNCLLGCRGQLGTMPTLPGRSAAFSGLSLSLFADTPGRFPWRHLSEFLVKLPFTHTCSQRPWLE